MNRYIHTSVLCCAMVVALAACGTDTDDSSATASGTDPNETQTPSGNAGDDTPGLIAGTFTGMNLAPGTKLAVLWLVSSSNPDYDYKLGEGAIDADGSYLITLPETLPVEAINDWGIGVGLPIILAENATLPDGIVSGDDFERLVVGFSPRHSIIWRETNVDADRAPWGGVFEEVTVVLGVWNRTKASTDMSQWIVPTLSISRDSMTITTSVIGASNPWYFAWTTV